MGRSLDWGGSRLVIVVAALLFAGVTALRFLAGDDPGSPYTVLYVLPIGLLATRYGPVGGLLAAALATVLFSAWTEIKDVEVGVGGWLARMGAFVLVGAGLGMLRRVRDREERRSSRWFAMSNDLLCEANFDGYFTEVNESWETYMGWTRAEMLSRPFLDLVHPDDQEATIEAAGALSGGNYHLVEFENRYRAKNGAYHWLLWSARSDSERIYCVGKDITERKRLEGDREELLTRVEAMARTDDLTGLPNRRAWEEELRREIARARRTRQEVSVALLDLDRFKDYNDEHGHPAGDQLLSDAGAAWRLVLREGDFIARYGGEEFAVVFPACPAAAAADVVSRLAAVVPAGQTLTAGVASLREGESAESLMDRVDSALYEGKGAGRDRTVVSEV